MYKRLLIIAVVTLFSYNFFLHQNFINPQIEPLKIIQQSDDLLRLSWKSPELQVSEKMIKGNLYSLVEFQGCSYSQAFGNFEIPLKTFLLGIPDGAQVNYEISNIVYEIRNNITLAPAATIDRDKNGISIYRFIDIPKDKVFHKPPVIEISEQEFFRDLPLVKIKFFPVQYDQTTKVLKIIKSATLKFMFSGGNENGVPFIPRARLDHLYKKLVLNFDQARNWIVRKPRTFKKPTASFSGPWFKIKVTEKGLYRINRATLIASGIDVTDIDPRTIKIYNHGGKPLDTNTNSLVEVPEGPVETAIYIHNTGAENQFDSDDYVLFYGRGVGGWHYSESNSDFVYIQHPYDTKNFYLFTYGGDPGKRMQELTTPSGGAGATDTYFMERVHYENDQYNLLSSGADWYGYNFSGRAHEISLNYHVDYLSTTSHPARMNIKFKGGSGLTLGDDNSYRYIFSVWINPAKVTTPIISNHILAEENSTTIPRTFNSLEYLKEGLNSVYIKYTGNYEDCEAYLDWVEFLYPRDFYAVKNQLFFFTYTLGQIVNYTVTGFSAENIQLFDISNPIDVKILETGSTVQDGNFSFNLDLSANKHKQLLITSLNSSEINNVGSMDEYQPRINLMDQSLSAELIVVTHPLFVEPYANEIVDLRATGSDPLKGLVVTTDDIYFYFASGVKDVVAIRNFIRYAYYNWSTPKPEYILLFGDGHYDYRNIALQHINWVPPFEISADLDLHSRETDNFYVDINLTTNSLSSIRPDLAIGRLPVDTLLDAQIVVDKLKSYVSNKSRDGWQTVLTFVADDEITSTDDDQWMHQRQTEQMAQLSELTKFRKKKIYLSAYESVPGGFGRVKPKANQAIIDQLNEGTLLINYVGHGSPEDWAHEYVLNMSRDLNRIQNENKLPLCIAATCDFGKYDDPYHPSFTEALIWRRDKGAIAVLSSSRLVYSFLNSEFNKAYLRNLFPNGGSSIRLGEALLLSTDPGENDQKYHLFGDPSMYLADPRNYIEVSSVSPDTLKALSKVTVSGLVSEEFRGDKSNDFSGGAFLIANDARYDSVNTGGPDYYTLIGPRIFKGEVTVENGLFSGEFIVPKSIRYHNQPTGRITVYAWDENGNGEAMGYVDTLLYVGTSEELTDTEGPEISMYFEGQEEFHAGDLVNKNPVLIAEIYDENGINLTQEVGHKIEIQIDEKAPRDITSFFAYERNSYSNGQLFYHLDNLESGTHQLKLQAWDNLNNPTTEEIDFRVVASAGLVLRDVVNYPNPFTEETNFTFQLLGASVATELKIKVYTITGRLVRSLENLTPPGDGFNYYLWDGRDDDGDIMANGVYIYKIIVKNDQEQKEAIEKLVILR